MVRRNRISWTTAIEPADPHSRAGEQQRLGFARLLFHRPAIVFADEATSALDEDIESQVMRRCQQEAMAMVSVGHRPSLLKYHEKVMKLDGKGGFTLATNEEFQKPSERAASAEFIARKRTYPNSGGI